MKAKSRKRLLLSSVAMLLVAMLALGTATFAWFTTNPNANASGLKLKATASKGLLIQTESHKTAASSFWGHDDFLNYDSTTHVSKTSSVSLNPVSFDYATADTLGSAYKVDAANSGVSAAADANKVSNATGGIQTGDYFQEKIFCKVTGGAETGSLKLTGITIDSAEGIDMLSGMRIAIEYGDALIGAYSMSGEAQTNNYLTAPNEYTSGTTAYSAMTKTSKQFTVPAMTADAPVTLGNVGTDGSDYVTVTIYLDGEDGNVFSDGISASDMINSVTVDLHVD